jgi:hypothetical protein
MRILALCLGHWDIDGSNGYVNIDAVNIKGRQTGVENLTICNLSIAFIF